MKQEKDMKQKFTVIDPAVQFIAGKRVPDSRIVEMTAEEARYDVQAGVLAPLEVEPKGLRTRSAAASVPPVEG